MRGRVWRIVAQEQVLPNDNLYVISTRQVSNREEVRVLGETRPSPAATAAEPRLEDGYIWLMDTARAGGPFPPGAESGSRRELQ